MNQKIISFLYLRPEEVSYKGTVILKWSTPTKILPKYSNCNTPVGGQLIYVSRSKELSLEFYLIGNFDILHWNTLSINSIFK